MQNPMRHKPRGILIIYKYGIALPYHHIAIATIHTTAMP